MVRRPPAHHPELKVQDFEVAERLAALRWPEGFVCPLCEHPGGYHLRSRPRAWQCAKCRGHTSVTAGTGMHGTKLPLVVWEKLTALADTPTGISALQASNTVDIRYHTVWRTLHRIRMALPSADLPVEGGDGRAWTVSGYKIPLTGLGFVCTGASFLNEVDVLVGVPADTPDAVPLFGLPRSVAQLRLGTWRPWSPRPRPPGVWGLEAATDAAQTARLRGVARALDGWLGRTHRHGSARWFGSYARFYRRALERPAPESGGAFRGAVLRAPAAVWRTFRPPLPDVMTVARRDGDVRLT